MAAARLGKKGHVKMSPITSPKKGLGVCLHWGSLRTQGTQISLGNRGSLQVHSASFIGVEFIMLPL